MVTQGTVRADYDPWHQSISALNLGARGWIQDALFLLLGCVLLGTGSRVGVGFCAEVSDTG